MKIVIAPDSYKESLSASEVAQAIEKGFREIFPDAQYVSLPVADGGEGTVEAMIAATQGKEHFAWVTGPLGERVKACWGMSGDGVTAFIEMAAASGLGLVPPDKRNPLITTSRGTGELILQALEHGAERIIIGIGVRTMLVAFNTWLLLRASLETALSAGLWNAGSLNGLTWGKTWPSAPLILLMLVSSALLVRRMRLLEMGDDTACALGVQVERSRLLLMLVAVVLTAASTALAGPISFIALVAPHIARRLSGTARWGLTQSALCGALLLALADYGAQRLFMPWQLPVGVLTVSLGGIYLIALLIQESRKK
ncbi:glycerate kinase [Klebsiella pneumoniae]|nr:glycerate kinase [Klebsiella pneumoniae]